MTGITPHRGGERPYAPDAIVVCRLRCGAITKPIAAGKLRWDHDRMPNDPGDIIASREARKDDL